MTCNDIYAELVSRCLLGDKVTTRNAECRRTFAAKYVFDAAPLVSVRKTAWKTALREMEAFIAGVGDVEALHPSARPWWEKQCDEYGCMPNGYGDQFRRSAGYGIKSFDQIEYLIDGITKHPFSRRNLITTWNTAEMASPETIVTNCHGTVIQAFVDTGNDLHLVTYQRSADVIVGVPHNWIQYWAMLQWLASRCGRGVGSLTWIGGDCHVYECHVPLAQRIVAVSNAAPPPGLVYTPASPDFKADDFNLSGGYRPVILDRAEMVV